MNQFKNPILVALLLSLLALPSPSSFANLESLRSMPDDLYEQPMIYDLDFDSLSIEEQNRKLTAEFLEKKRLPLWDAFVSASINAGSTSLGAIGGGLAYWWFSSRRGAAAGGAGGAPAVNAGADAGGVSIYMTIFGGMLLTSFVGVQKAYQDYYNPKLRDPLQPLELEYIVRKRFLTPGLQNQIENQLRLARSEPAHMGQTTELVRLAMNLPQKSRKARFDRNIINDLFVGYPEKLRNKVERFSIRQVMNQTSEDDYRDQEAKQGKRAAAYFFGAPGSGKTRFAELIAKALDLPFAKISLEGASIGDLIGRSTNSGNPTPGLIAKAMSKAKINGQGAKNMVLFIDEADRVINDSSSEILPFMLKMLDPENKSFYSPYLDDDIDTSRLTIILAGNYKIQDDALRKRLFVINFTGFDLNYKRKIVWEDNLPKKCESYSQSGDYSISMHDFTAEDRKYINDLIDADRDPGFRTIESALSEYMDYMSDRKYFNYRAEAPDLMRFIEDSNKKIDEQNLENSDSTIESQVG